MSPGTRILQFIDYKGYGEGRKGKSFRAFYDFVGIPTGSIKPERSIGTENLNKIFLKFPDLNMDWVITGRGEMLYKEHENANEWKEKYYKLLDMKITMVSDEKEALKKAPNVDDEGHTDKLTIAAEEEIIIKKNS